MEAEAGRYMHQDRMLKGGEDMKKNGVSLAEFIQEDRFELNSYITSLFNKLNDYVPKSIKDKK